MQDYTGALPQVLAVTQGKPKDLQGAKIHTDHSGISNKQKLSKAVMRNDERNRLGTNL